MYSVNNLIYTVVHYYMLYSIFTYYYKALLNNITTM